MRPAGRVEYGPTKNLVAPGESVYLKAGATPTDPVSTGNDLNELNVDKGFQSQSQGGQAASVAGDIANGVPAEEAGNTPKYVSIRRRHIHTTGATTTGSGELSLLVGTDSGFEGVTGLYYQRVTATLIPVG